MRTRFAAARVELRQQAFGSLGDARVAARRRLVAARAACLDWREKPWLLPSISSSGPESWQLKQPLGAAACGEARASGSPVSGSRPPWPATMAAALASGGDVFELGAWHETQTRLTPRNDAGGFGRRCWLRKVAQQAVLRFLRRAARGRVHGVASGASQTKPLDVLGGAVRPTAPQPVWQRAQPARACRA